MASNAPISIVQRRIAEDREVLRRAVEMVPRTRRNERPAEGRWSVAEILEHLAIVEERSLKIIQKLIADAPARSGQSPSAPTPHDRRALRDRSQRISAPEFIEPTGTMSADEAWARLERSRRGLDAVLATIGDRDLTKVSRVHPALGHLDGYQSIDAIGGHEERHAAQIRDIASRFES
jgi:hypothetical protein